MKRIMLMTALVICAATSVFTQQPAEAPKVNLPDDVMEQVVKRIVTWYFKAPKKPKTIYFADVNIKKEWLPTVKNVDFVIAEKESKRSVFQFRKIEKEGKGFTVMFGYGDSDLGYGVGDNWAFKVVRSRVRLWKLSGGWESTPWESALSSRQNSLMFSRKAEIKSRLQNEIEPQRHSLSFFAAVP